MKKQLIKMLVVIALLPCLLFGVVACGDGSHDHKFSQTVLSFDDTHHWYACEVDGCKEVDSKQEHALSKQVVEDRESKEEMVMYTCKDCDYTKIISAGEGSDEGSGEGEGEGSGDGGSSGGSGPDWWNQALSQQIVGIKQVVHTVTGNIVTDVEMLIDPVNKRVSTITTAGGTEVKIVYAKVGNEYFKYTYILGQWNKTTMTENEFNLYLNPVTSTQALFTALKGKYDDFTYAEGVYTLNDLNEGDWVANKITLKFEDEKLTTMTTYVSNSSGTSDATMTLGTVEIEVPQV